MSEVPLVSVLISAYNPGEYFRPSLDSILAQSHRNIEVLVIDDGGTDGAVEVHRESITDDRVRWFRQENSGKSVALNFALNEIHGTFYAIHDADDISHPDRIMKLLQVFEDNSDVAAVFSGYDLLLGGRCVAPRFRAKDREECRADVDQFRMPSHDPTVMYRVDAVCGELYEPALRIGQGYDHILRVGEQHPMMVVGECLYSYRVTTTSNTKRDPSTRVRMIAEVYRRAHERRGLPTPSIGQSETRRWGRADNNLAALFIESVLDLRSAGRLVAAVRTGIECVCLRVFDPHHYKALVYAMIPGPLIRLVRARAANRARE